MKLKLEGGKEIELPGDFESEDALVAAYQTVIQDAQAAKTARDQLKAFEPWGDPATLEARLTAHIDKVKKEAVDAALAEGATKKQAKQAGKEAADVAEDQLDTMTPAQQMAYLESRLTERLSGLLKQQVDGYWSEAQKQLLNANGMSQQQFDLLAKGLDLKLRNPNVDLPALWTKMTELAKATPEQLMQMAVDSLQSPAMWDQKLKDERGKWDAEQKAKQEQESLRVLNSNSSSNFFKREEERPSLNKPGGDDAMKQSILSRALANGDIQANQI